MRPLVILGAGGHGREILDIVETINVDHPAYEFLGFLDDTPGGPDVLAGRDLTLLGPTSDLQRIEADYVVGMGSPCARRHFDRLATSWGRHAATLVHPAATVGSDISMAPGCVVAAGARITTSVQLGRHTHLNINSTISHDCRVGRYVTISPGVHVNGWVVIEDDATLGSGAVVRDRVTVGQGTVVGAGAVVVGDLPAFVVATGVPARSRPPCRG